MNPLFAAAMKILKDSNKKKTHKKDIHKKDSHKNENRCPACGYVLRKGDSQGKKKVICRNCGQTIPMK